MSEPITLYNDEGGSLVVYAPGFADHLVASGQWQRTPPALPTVEPDEPEQEDEEFAPVPLTAAQLRARKRKAGG